MTSPAGWSLLGMAGDGRRRPRDDMIVGLNNMTDIQIFRKHSTASGKIMQTNVRSRFINTTLSSSLVSGHPQQNKTKEYEQSQLFC